MELYRKTTATSQPPTFTSARYIIAYIGFTGFLFICVMRTNMSIAIVCMVDQNYTNENRTTMTFSWSRELQGYVLSSFFYGNLITQMPGGYLADRYGGKNVFIAGMMLSAVATILIPVSAQAHYGLLILMRFLVGLGTGVVFPCMQAVWAKWAPLFERTKLITFTFSGFALGSVVAFSLSGIVCDEFGWSTIFYFSGGLSFLWCLSWWFGVYDSPKEHPFVKQVEVDYINKHLKGLTNISKDRSIEFKSPPWKDILTSLPVWAICAAHMANSWIGLTQFVCMPMYMSDVLHFDIKANGLYSSIPSVVGFIVINITSYTADFLRSRGVRTVVVRKGVTLMACIIAVVTNVWIGFLSSEESYTALALLILGAVGISVCRPAHTVNHVDIAPRYAGILYGISNTFATITGILTPIVVGQLTPRRSREEWQVVFIICAVVNVVGNVFYLVFAQGEEQEWAKVEEMETVEFEPANTTHECKAKEGLKV